MIKEHLNLLGLKVKDCVTNFTGVVSTISFDLYGCVQAIVTPQVGKDGIKKDAHWFDVNRLKVLSKDSVMDVPNFDTGPYSEALTGPNEKPHNDRY